MRSSGADIVEGFAALHGWGLAAKALTDCSGVVPIIMVVEGPAVSGPALLLGIADFVVMTVGLVRVRHRPDDGGRVHRRARSTTTSSAARHRTPATPARRASSLPTSTTAIDMVAQLLAYLPQHNDEEPRALADRRSARSADARGRRADAADLDGQLRRARRDPGDRRRRRAARAARPLGAQRRHRVRHDRRAARSASSPTSRWPSPARSTSRRRRRRPGSSRSATRSTCRS